jgi:hypothetical protein
MTNLYCYSIDTKVRISHKKYLLLKALMYRKIKRCTNHEDCETQVLEPFSLVPDPSIFHRLSSLLQQGGHANVHATAAGPSGSFKNTALWAYEDGSALLGRLMTSSFKNNIMR